MKKKCTKTGLRVEQVLFSRNKKRVKAIYYQAFPKSERMPFWLMIAMSCLPTTKFIAFYDGNMLCGFIYMGKIFRQGFILFFTVDDKLRSNGYGSRILSAVRERYPKCRIAVTIEPCDGNSPDPLLCQRRKAFYMRNGFADTGYNIKLNGMTQEILISGGSSFYKARFSAFLLVYSCLAIIPIIKPRK